MIIHEDFGAMLVIPVIDLMPVRSKGFEPLTFRV